GGGILGGVLELGAGGADHLGRRAGAACGEELGGQAGVVPELGAGGLAIVPLLLQQAGTTGDLAAQVLRDLPGAPGRPADLLSRPGRRSGDRGCGRGGPGDGLVEVLVPASGAVEVRQPLTQRPRTRSFAPISIVSRSDSAPDPPVCE